jgi:hypothetical protein
VRETTNNRILTASGDTTARLCEASLDPQALIDRVKAEVPRCLTAEQRERLFLMPEPPPWCVDMHKWPYDRTTVAKPWETDQCEEAMPRTRSVGAEPQHTTHYFALHTFGQRYLSIFRRAALPIVVDRRRRFECAARILPVATSSAANSVVVPWRPVSDSPVEIRCGAGFMKAGLGAIDWSGLGITTAAIVFSPLLGFALALLLVLTVSWVFARPPSRSTTYSASAPSKGGMALSSFAMIAARARS